LGSELPPSLLGDLRAAVGDLSVDPDELAGYATDRSSAEPCVPAAVCRPRSTAEVSELVAACAAAGTPVVPRGAGTGKAGGCVPTPGSVVCSLENLSGIQRIAPEDQLVEVLPGTLTGELRCAAAEAGWFFPPDPASLDECTVGGNVATNAGGPSCLKYGVTGDYVLGLEVVLADGRVVRPGRRSIKGVAGYDLCSLITGSEGTLGIVTRVIARIVPRPPAVLTAWITFDDTLATCRAVAAVMGAGVQPRTAELMDRAVLHALGRDEGAALLIEVDGTEAGCREQMAALERTLADHPVRDLQLANDETHRQTLWEMRREASVAVKQPFDRAISEDVAVPVSRIPDLAQHLERIGEDHNITVAAYGHAGDGNLHVNLLSNGPSLGEATEAVIRVALDLGGTLTGEHGIGTLKRPYLPLEHPPDLLDAQQRIKAALDPAGVLNPGKIF